MLTAVGDVLRECYRRSWITTRDGNISLRRSTDGVISHSLYLTPSAWRKNIIHPEHLIKVRVDGASQPMFEGTGVSTEFRMHYLLQQDAKTTRAVVHVHSTHIVAALSAGIDLQAMAAEFPEISRYTRVGPSIGVVPAGSPALAEGTNHAFRGADNGPLRFDIVGQKNHGVCAIGKHPWDAFEHIERLDHICQITLLAGSWRKSAKD